MAIGKYFAKSFEDYLKFGILMGFSLLMLKLILDGKISYYINPKMFPLVVICAIFLILIAFVLFLKTKSRKSSKSKVSYLLFIIPLCMGYFVPAKTISEAPLQISGGTNQSLSSSNTLASDAISNNENEYKNQPQESQNISELKKRTVVLEDRNFTIMLDSLFLRMEEYNGCNIEITGKVFKDASMKSNEFAVVRPMMSCCSADTQLVGLVCSNNTEIKVNNDVWAKIEGKLSIVDSKKGKMPVVDVQKITMVDRPKNEFVYPY